ncbi:nitroreductase family deazaflavin-dependent oxidoreductase [Nocardia sp. 2]|uniref:Nitroreductase family deazaflavin-dependent oxidoreductase n=1 Tax=Nocardia acididurans TaxID=2802282 RepID=A0ABS1M037_9NOCA|nr:nitroreductase/quinone reductase family protein [Nocardia acididurans]MBL1073871.1 nitroreductase family deazaflavin-dependent oxidoreductase [Nocardia acididurans]
MTQQTPEPNPYGTPTTTGPEPIRASQGRINAIVRTLLRLPLLSRLVGKRLAVLTVTGRKSGRVYEIPVAYTRHGSDILIGTNMRPWVRNISKDVPVEVSFGGPKRPADAEVHTDLESVMRLYEIVARDNKNNAGFNGIGFDPDGSPNKADIYQSWQQGGVVIRLTPR